jgi:hypothetical protein
MSTFTVNSLTSTVKRNEMGCAVNMEDITNAYTILIKKQEQGTTMGFRENSNEPSSSIKT